MLLCSIYNVITCNAVAVSKATVGLTALLLLTNSKKRSQLSFKTCKKTWKVIKPHLIRDDKTNQKRIEKVNRGPLAKCIYNSTNNGLSKKAINCLITRKRQYIINYNINMKGEREKKFKAGTIDKDFHILRHTSINIFQINNQSNPEAHNKLNQ